MSWVCRFTVALPGFFGVFFAMLLNGCRIKQVRKKEMDQTVLTLDGLSPDIMRKCISGTL